MPRNSTNNIRYINCLYLHAPAYRKVALERLERDNGLLSPSYRALLERQIGECEEQMWKKNRPDGIIRKNNY